MLGRNAFIVPDVLKVPIQGTRQVRPPAIHSRTNGQEQQRYPQGNYGQGYQQGYQQNYPSGSQGYPGQYGQPPPAGYPVSSAAEKYLV